MVVKLQHYHRQPVEILEAIKSFNSTQPSDIPSITKTPIFCAVLLVQNSFHNV